MKRILSSVAAIVLMSSMAFAQNIPMDPSVRTGTLPNGMKYYIKKNNLPEKKVDFRLAINAGSILEDENQRGLAHFMEHMNFNGTKNFPDNKLVDFLQSIGVKFGQHLNAYTSFDETVYMLPVPLDKPGNLDSGLKVMEDWAFNATLTDEQINKERGVVLEELRLGLGADKRMSDKYLPKLLYKSQYANRLPIGTKEVLQNFKPDVIRQFHKDWYRPDLMALVVVGDINVDEVEKKIKDNFSKYKNPSKPRERKTFDLPNHKETLVAIETDPDATNSMVQFIMKDADSYTPDVTVEQYNQSLIENLSTQMLNNRLRELVNSNNPPFTFGSVYHGGTYARTKEAFQGFAMVKEGNQINALKVLLEETERAKRFGFTQSELDRAKSQIMSNMESSYNNRDKTESDMLVDEYVRNFLEQEPMPGISWEYEDVKKFLPSVTLAQTNDVIKKMVKDDSRVIVITGPKKDNVTMPTEALVLKTFDDVKMADLKPYEEKATIKNLVKPFKSEGEIAKTDSDAKLGTTTWTLSNGAKVTFKKTDFKDDEIVFSARSLGGNSLLNDTDFNKTQFAYQALTEAGVNGASKAELTNYLAGKQVSVNPYISSTLEGIMGRTNQKDLGTAMELVYAYFTNLNYSPEAFNAYKVKQSAMLDNILSNPQTYFASEHAKFTNQKNPRFIGILPLEKDWAATDYKKAYDVYKEKFANAGNFHFYFVGNIDEAKFKNEVLQYIASLPTTGKTTNFKDTGYRGMTGDHTKVYKKGKDPKSMVQIVYSGETPYNEKEALALAALGEVATIKVIEKLREDESGIYGGGARGYMGKVPYSSYSFSLSFPCGPENADKLTKSAIAEIQKLIDKGPEQKDLDKYKEGEMNDYKTDMKDNNYWMNAISKNQLDGSDKYDILNYQEKVKALTVKDLQDVAKKYLTKNRVVATLMPEDGWENAPKKETSGAVKATVVK
ncbi:M16 family metallopeptidase [Chryseobacterium balustinum]|uniref:Protease 3 n=1 Tax=Chryseobacterium balustinum TaxID=246 RepID=A0AAX2IKX0_9FLAO|nr:M16 family metallopeptidase [Chryseobacterium balustinum]AZB28014.1 insulinase family protein [Chryseobacterium balustinum]SKB55504.1 zinc protease [Chryseobacterium balustinum]SQA89760.1 Protease 3 precursor [Chryseobacterium balustinum]